LKAIILAAGEGKRLRPLTNELPKCLVKLFGKSILERQIEIYRKSKIKDIIIVTGYKKEKIKILNIHEYINKEFDSTNMLETLFCAKNELEGSVIISYGDIIFEKKILDSLINSKEDFSVIIDKKWKEYWFARMDEPIKDAESLKLDSNGYITNIGEPVKNIDEIEGQYIGLMKFQNEGLKIMKEFYNKMKNKAKESGNNPLNPNIPFKKSYMTDFIRGLIVDGHKIKAIPIENGWLELDTYQDYKIYKRMFDEKTISNFIKMEEKK
jgi:L-glutamine-phosphate cytidylyltransferase